MRYFPRVRHPEQYKVWELFKDVPKFSTRYELPTLEIIRAAWRGSIDLNRKFHLVGYSATTFHNHALRELERQKKFLPLLNSWDNGSSPDKMEYGVQESNISSYQTTLRSTNPDDIEENFDFFFRQDISRQEMEELSKETQETLGFDIITTVRNAVRGSKSASVLLRSFTQEHPEALPVITSYMKDVLYV